MVNTKKVAIVTGGSSGIGMAVADILCHEYDFIVYEFSRNGSDRDGVKHLKCDVSDRKIVFECVDHVQKTEGRIDLLINNAGCGVAAPLEFMSEEEIRTQIDVNLIGSIFTMQACMRYMRGNTARIVNVSSIGAIMALPFQSVYSMTKSSMNIMTLALANELKGSGVSVCCVMLGDVSTGFTGARKKGHSGEMYTERLDKAIEIMANDEMNGSSDKYIANKICAISMKKRVREFYAVKMKYKLFCFLNRLLPSRLINRIMMKLYS